MITNSSREAAELVRCISVDKNRKGRFRASQIKSQFDNITHKIGRPRPEPEDSEEDEKDADLYRRKYESNIRQRSIQSSQKASIAPETETTPTNYPKSWLREPGAKKSNLYANKLSNLLSS